MSKKNLVPCFRAASSAFVTNIFLLLALYLGRQFLFWHDIFAFYCDESHGKSPIGSPFRQHSVIFSKIKHHNGSINGEEQILPIKY